MVPYRHDAVQPLLPFEKRLIAELGIDEAEYRKFAAEVARRPYTRSTAYANVPDVRNEGFLVSLAVSLIVGALFTAASYLLTPKPQQPDSTKFRTKQLGSKTGKEIFSPSYGFDSLQELAAYGNTVPIVFTRQQENTDASGSFVTGGVLVSPAMVWSRVKSFGSHQITEIIAVAGQGPMAPPDLAGILLGNNALDGIFKDFFDFYWNEGNGTARLRIENLRYGDLRIDNGLGGQQDAFYAATREGANQPAFSGAMTPSNQIRFGVYSGIPNGTPVRPDWEVVSILDDWDTEQKRQAWNTQRKYVDPYDEYTNKYGGNYKGNRDFVKAGMPGTGRNYCRRIGIVSHTSAATGAVTTHTETRREVGPGIPYWENLTTTVVANKNDEIVILYGKNRQEQKPFGDKDDNIDPVRLDDIRSSVDAELQKIDQLFARGATFMVGRTTWVVIERPVEPYNPRQHSKAGYRIRLRCTDAWSNNGRMIGIVAEDAISRTNYLPHSDIEESFYPILRYELGTFQNNRRCDVTEIGLRSQVWARFNGITNFNTITSPGVMANFNAKNVTLKGGKLTQYARRVSFFALDVRPTNNKVVTSYNRNEGWENLGPHLFAVIGDAPIDIYSFIRISHPNRSQLEFRLRPFNSAIFTQQSGGETSVFALDGGRPGYTEWTTQNYMGTFRVGGRGHFIKPRDYFTHSQMAVKPETESGESNIDKLIYGEWVPDTTRIDVTLNSVTAAEAGSGYNPGDAAYFNTVSNIMSVHFGEDPYFANLADGTVRTKTGWQYVGSDNSRSIVMTVTVRSETISLGHTARNKWWKIQETDVASFTGSWNNGDTFTKTARSKDGVLFAFNYTVNIPQKYVEYDTPQSATRIFERYSGIAEVSHYGDLVTRSCDSNPEHEIVYVNESLSEDIIPNYTNCATLGLKLQSSNNFQQLDQVRCLMQNGIRVTRLIDNDVAPSNLLTDLLWYLATNTDTGAGKIISASLLDRNSLTATGRFLRANNLFFDDAITEPINLRTWLAQIAPSVLCYTTLKNGRLSLEPALPYNNSYKIDPYGALTIKGMFTEGNILEDSLKIEWLELEDRKMFQAAVLFKWTGLNKVPEQRTLVVRYKGYDAGELPLEEFQLDHITGTTHALYAARYFLAVRKHITHTITFQTLPWGMSLAPGDYIRITTEVSPYNPANNGIVKEDGTVIAVSPMADGNYTVYYWDRTQPNVATGTLAIANGRATSLRNSVFSVVGTSSSNQVYQIEALDVDTDGIVTIKASNHPITSNGASRIARDVLNVDNVLEVIGGSLD